MSAPETFWVLSGPMLPVGARKLRGATSEALGAVPEGRHWLDVCILGQHLPQMYRLEEMHELTAADCPRLGLCPDCLGFGDTEPRNGGDLLWLGRRIDEVRRPCLGCGGTGRPALRIGVRQGTAGLEAQIRPVPHAYVPPMPADAMEMAAFGIPEGSCLACGMVRDGTGPHGEQLHPDDASTTAAGEDRP